MKVGNVNVLVILGDGFLSVSGVCDGCKALLPFFSIAH